MQNKFASCSLSDFSDKVELHRSAAGSVFLSTFKFDKGKYVLKQRKYSELGVRRSPMHEIDLLTQLNHPNIVTCEGWFRDEYSKSLVIVLEYCEGGDLYNFITTYPLQFIPEEVIWYIFTQVHFLSNAHIFINNCCRYATAYNTCTRMVSSTAI